MFYTYKYHGYFIIKRYNKFDGKYYDIIAPNSVPVITKEDRINTLKDCHDYINRTKSNHLSNKEMETKSISIRIPVELLKEVTKNGNEQQTESIVELLERSIADRKAAMIDIKGIFTKEEWVAIADSMNGTMITDPFWYSRDAFIAHCEDAELYESSFSRHKADVKVVCNKIKQLTSIQVATVYRRIIAFWQDCNNIDMGKWSEF